MNQNAPGPSSGLEPLDSDEKKQLRWLGALAVCWTLLPALCGFYLLARIDLAKDQLDAIGGNGAILVYICFFALTSGLGLLPTYAQAFLGGWVFGASYGSLGAIAGIVGGAMIGFVLARLVSGPGVERVIEGRAKIVAIRNALVGEGWLRTLMIVGLLRLSPNSPFALMNLAMGSARTPVLPYIIGTGLGIIPRTVFAAVIAAAAASDGSQNLADVIRNQGWFVSILGVVILIGSIAIVGAIGKQALNRMVRAGDEAKP